MKIEITLDKENLLLRRREIKFEVVHDGAATPNKFEVSEILAAKLNAQMDMMIVSLSTQFGSNISKGTCVIYKDKDAMKTAESQKILNERKMVGKKQEEPKAEEPAKEEIPKETKPDKEEAAKETQTEEPKPDKEEIPAEKPKEGGKK